MKKYVPHVSPLLIGIGLLFLCIFPIYAGYHHSSFLNDDTYISLTFVKNLAHGNGFVYNHPPAILGATSPLFVFLVALPAYLFPKIDIAQTAVFLTVFCWIATIWTIFIFREAWCFKDWEAGLLGFVILGSGWLDYLGMEAYLFTFLLVLGLTLFFYDRFLASGLILGLLFLTRGEGILVFGLALTLATGKYWLKTRRLNKDFLSVPARLLLGFVIPFFLWCLYAFPTFGSILPNTLPVKQAQMQSGFGLSFLQRLVNEWIPQWGAQYTLHGMPLAGLWWIFIGMGFITAIYLYPRWLVFPGWIALYLIGYILLNVSAASWYQLPILFMLQLFFGLGIIGTLVFIARLLKSNWAASAISVSLVIVALGVFSRPAVKKVLNPQGDFRGASYTALSKWFQANSTRSESIAFFEIGYLGYFTDNRIIDLEGLVTPGISPHIAKSDYAWGFWNYLPDFYLYLPEFDPGLADIRSDPRFISQYQAVATLPGPRTTDFIIYKRVKNSLTNYQNNPPRYIQDHLLTVFNVNGKLGNVIRPQALTLLPNLIY